MRIKWVDILKGIGIITVVFGHAKLDFRYMFYWFHMPLFFFVSGYLYRPDKFSYKKKLKALLIPYFMFYLVVTLIRFIQKPFSIEHYFGVEFEKLLIGGEMLKYYYGVFWFVTALLFITFLYHFIVNKFGFRMMHSVIASMYILSYFGSTQLRDAVFFADIDVVPFAIVFYHLGYMFKLYEEKIKKYFTYLTSAAILIVTSFVVAVFGFGFHYRLNIKYQQYDHPIIDIIIPLAFILLLMVSTKVIEKVEPLSKLLISFGSGSMTIMFLHMSFLRVFPDYINNVYIVILLSLLTSWGIHYLIKKNRTTSMLFLGGK